MQASLPLAKLCAMVTMQKRGEPSVQTFALNLQQVAPPVQSNSPETRAKVSTFMPSENPIFYWTEPAHAF